MAGPVKRRLEEVEGRRVETAEWGARSLWGSAPMGRKAGHVEEASEQRARWVVNNPERKFYIMPPLILVRRTVVTYTTEWVAVPGEPPYIQTRMRQPEGWVLPQWAIPPGADAADDPSDSMDPLF